MALLNKLQSLRGHNCKYGSTNPVILSRDMATSVQPWRSSDSSVQTVASQRFKTACLFSTPSSPAYYPAKKNKNVDSSV
ncbi:hypothetical protein N3K66_002215 [Trichothecium roseum]|uniref:Uncharacterized protein n=1 Tax=Trichothecium roseum TaxID=47278 RepID=A0ACC0V9Q1_9HYPO|nr:hypothetical protein N3K66_002215 [Trichothecium roseum]